MNGVRMDRIWKAILEGQMEQLNLTQEELLWAREVSRVHSALNRTYVDAPMDAIERAKSLMPKPERRSILATLLPVQGQLSWARGALAKQSSYDSEGTSIRIQFEPSGKGLRVLGRIGAAGWFVLDNGEPVACGESGEFELFLVAGSPREITLLSAGLEIRVPLDDGNQSDP